jgi:hypothetical protein
MLGNSLVAEQLAVSQEGYSSMELVTDRLNVPTLGPLTAAGFPGEPLYNILKQTVTLFLNSY